MKKRTCILFLLGALVCPMVAENNIIEIKPTKKIIHVDQLGYSQNTPIMDVLQTMPELLDRRSADGSLLSNYTIQIDDRGVGQSRDVVLQQTIVAEVDVIEVQTSPTVSEQKNGTGGVINIKLKPIHQDGVSGMALLDASTEWDVQPSVLVNYRKDKFLLRSSFRAEYYRPTDRGISYIYGRDVLMESYDTTWSSYKQETAKLYLEYKPTSQDELKVSAWESYARNHDWSDRSILLMMAKSEGSSDYTKSERTETGDKREASLTVEGFIGYNHKYVTHEGELNIEAQYNYMPTQSNQAMFYPSAIGMLGGDRQTMTDNWDKSQQVVGEVSSKHVVWRHEVDNVDLKYGLNASYMFGNTYKAYCETLLGRVTDADTTDTDNGHIYASPYIEMNAQIGRWAMQAGLRYQYYRVNIHDQRTNIKYTDNHTVTGNVSVRCLVAKDHNLRLNLARNIRRVVGVDAITIYPYYDADLNYIYDWRNDAHSVTTSVGADYIYAQQAVGYTGTACVNAQLIYQYKIFSMAFAGNAYVRTYYGDINAGKHYWYYNLSLSPVLSLRKQWTLSGKMVYNSKMETLDAKYGDCFYSQIRVAKQIRGWNIHLDLNDIFDYTTYNTEYTTGGTEYKSLDDMYPRNVQIGFSYMF